MEHIAILENNLNILTRDYEHYLTQTITSNITFLQRLTNVEQARIKFNGYLDKLLDQADAIPASSAQEVVFRKNFVGRILELLAASGSQ